ncbi:MAG: PQQ-binding-like beta-propeller repeat protein [Thermoguttaceae bacterium]|jgi:outer membrane protein assembly factor BamB
MKTPALHLCRSTIVALGLALCTQAADLPTITHDWPGYTGPDGTHADLSRVPLLEDLGKARLLWISEHDDLGHGKTSSKGGHVYGPKSKASGSADLIVAGGMVIVGYLTPRDEVVADDIVMALDGVTGQTRWKQIFAGKGYHRRASKHTDYGPAPAAADGKVFHLGTAGRIYCLELATGKPLWESDLGDYPAYYKNALATKARMKDEDIEGVALRLGRPLYTPLIVIGGRVYAVCSGGDETLRLVEPKSGKVLWTEKCEANLWLNREIMSAYSYIVADGRAFVPYCKDKGAGKGAAGPVHLAAFALSETGAKLLWQSKDLLSYDPYFAYRDGVIYANMTTDGGKSVNVTAFRAEDGTELSALIQKITSHFYLWGDRVVLEGDACHESLGHTCFYQSGTPGVKDLKLSGQPLAPRTFGKYTGVAGYIERWMRPTFADGFMFTRSVNKETGQGAILCWDLRAHPESKK